MRCRLTLMLSELSSTSKIKSRQTRSGFDAGCSAEAARWPSTATVPSGVTANDACINDIGVRSELRLLAFPSRGNSKYDSRVSLVVFRGEVSPLMIVGDNS
jgi:hypothetical protein